MNLNTDAQKLPEVVRFIPRILATLRAMNGVAKAGAVKTAVVQAIVEAGESVNVRADPILTTSANRTLTRG